MITDKILENIKSNIESASIDVAYETGTNSVIESLVWGSYRLDFYVNYETKERETYPATYLEPAEHDITFTPTGIESDSIEFYIATKHQELTDEQVDYIQSLLYWKIIHDLK